MRKSSNAYWTYPTPLAVKSLPIGGKMKHCYTTILLISVGFAHTGWESIELDRRLP